MRNRGFRALSAVCASALVLAVSSAAFADLSDDERKCSDTANKRGRNVGNQEQKANRTCVKDGNGSIEACVAATSSKATDQGAKLADEYLAGGKCDPLPPFGVESPASAITAGVVAGSDGIVRDVFGDPADGIVAGDKCADAVVKRGGKKFDTALKAFRKCAKDLGSIPNIGALDGCVATALSDPKTVGVQGKLAADMNNTKKCPAFPVAGADDGDCSGEVTAAGFATCAGDVVDCQACLAMNAITGGGADCDLLDNGAVDFSCGAFPAINLGTHKCTMGGTSQIDIKGALPLPPLPALGAVDIDCGTTGPDGKAACTCEVQAPGLAGLNIAGLFYACVKPAISGTCPTGEIDCNGGNVLGVDIDGNRNIGPCASQGACLTSCSAFCGGAANVVDSGCEGFCTDGANSACLTDAACGGLGEGSCDGPDGVGLGNVCDCTCVNAAVGGASAAGTLQCQLAFNLTVEPIPGNGMICDGADVSINVGDTCAPLSTQSAMAVLNNGNNGGGQFPPGGASLVGAPADCNAFAGSNTSAITLQGAAIFYASTIGDLNAVLTVDCQ